MENLEERVKGGVVVLPPVAPGDREVAVRPSFGPMDLSLPMLSVRMQVDGDISMLVLNVNYLAV